VALVNFGGIGRARAGFAAMINLYRMHRFGVHFAKKVFFVSLNGKPKRRVGVDCIHASTQPPISQFPGRRRT